jgi:hypothetical protein
MSQRPFVCHHQEPGKVRDSKPNRPRLALEGLEDRRLLSADIAVLDVTTSDFTHLDVCYSISGADSPAFGCVHCDMFTLERVTCESTFVSRCIC